MEERRSLERFVLRIPARMVSEQYDKDAIQLETRDISAKGAFIYTVQPLVAGTTVTLELVMPVEKFRQLLHQQSDVKLKIAGVVIRAEKEGMVVRFNRKYEIIPDIDQR